MHISGMHIRIGVGVLRRVSAIMLMSMGAALSAPPPETSTAQSIAREANADPASDVITTPVQNAAKDLTGVKDETRLPTETAETSNAEASSEQTPPKPVRAVEPKPVPELSRAEFCSTLAASAEKHDVPVALFANLIWQESRFRPQAVSPVGALGVAQFMPRVAEEVGLKNPFNPLEALPAAARFFRGLIERFGSEGLATAAYNAGSGRVGNWLKKRTTVLPKETQHYVRVITGMPADHWRSANAKRTAFAMAANMPCRSEAAFAKFDQADLPEQRQAVEQRLSGVAKVRAALRKTPPSTSIAKLESRIVVLKAGVASRPRIAADHRGRKAGPAHARNRIVDRRSDTRIRVAAGR